MSCTPRPTTTTSPEQRAVALSWIASRLAWERTLDHIRAGGQLTAVPAIAAAEPAAAEAA